MSYKINTITPFRRESKKLIKKYPSLKAELIELSKQLSLNPKQGSPLGNSCYKIRFKVASKGKGKSGGARIITHVYVSAQVVYLLSIYDKSEKETISDSHLKELLKYIEIE